MGDMEAMARTRAEHCPGCRTAAPDQRNELCLAEGCGLCDPPLWRDEWFWIVNLFHTASFSAGKPDPAQIAAFAKHVTDARAAVFLPRIDDQGHMGMYFAERTLLGMLHGLLTLLFLFNGGVIAANVEELTNTLIGREAEKLREVLRESRQDWIVRHRSHMSDNYLATILGINPKSIRDWYGPRDGTKVGDDKGSPHRG